jgi:hypothetical protein
MDNADMVASREREKTVGILAKSEQLLDHTGADPDGSQFFSDPEVENNCAVLGLTLEMWEDFGRPNQITIVIEPGDKLNHDSTLGKEK